MRGRRRHRKKFMRNLMWLFEAQHLEWAGMGGPDFYQPKLTRKRTGQHWSTVLELYSKRGHGYERGEDQRR